MTNPFTEINEKLDALTGEVRALKQLKAATPADEIGGLELAVQITGLAPRTLYKYTHRRAIPHSRLGGRLYFRRSELEGWISSGRRATAAELALQAMSPNK